MYINHAYGDLAGGRWLKGNLHAHSNRSDGAQPPQEVVDAYAKLGHGFLMISDHDVVNTTDDLAKLDSRGMVLIPGNEVSANGVHMLHVNTNQRIEPLADRQATIDAANKVKDSIIIVNHPNWFANFDHCPFEKLDAWQNYAGIEIYNGVIEVLEGSPLAIDHWDRLLSKGRRVLGFAHDDAHGPQHRGVAWNVAYVKDRSVAGVIDALRSGRFYASTGVGISRIEVDGDRISIESPDANRIIMYGKHQRRLGLADAEKISVSFPAGEPYVRFECLGRGGRCAWTQAFYAGT